MINNWKCTLHNASGSDDESLIQHFKANRHSTASCQYEARTEVIDFHVSCHVDDRSRAERAEHRCLELSREVGELKREIESLRTASDSIDRIAQRRGQALMEAHLTIRKLRSDAESHSTRCPIQNHVCTSPLGNPTREEAIEQRDLARRALQIIEASIRVGLGKDDSAEVTG